MSDCEGEKLMGVPEEEQSSSSSIPHLYADDVSTDADDVSADPSGEASGYSVYKYRDFSHVTDDDDPADNQAQLPSSFASLSSGNSASSGGNGSASGDNGGTSIRVQKFPVKLYAILAQKEFHEIACWMPHGRSWKVLKPGLFESMVMPLFFEYNNYHSFNRLVNAWSFRRISTGPDRGSYYHELFLRGLPHLQKYMRRLPKTHRKLPMKKDDEPDFYALDKTNPLPPLKYRDPLPASATSATGLGLSGGASSLGDGSITASPGGALARSISQGQTQLHDPEDDRCSSSCGDAETGSQEQQHQASFEAGSTLTPIMDVHQAFTHQQLLGGPLPGMATISTNVVTPPHGHRRQTMRPRVMQGVPQQHAQQQAQQMLMQPATPPAMPTRYMRRHPLPLRPQPRHAAPIDFQFDDDSTSMEPFPSLLDPTPSLNPDDFLGDNNSDTNEKGGNNNLHTMTPIQISQGGSMQTPPSMRGRMGQLPVMGMNGYPPFVRQHRRRFPPGGMRGNRGAGGMPMMHPMMMAAHPYGHPMAAAATMRRPRPHPQQQQAMQQMMAAAAAGGTPHGAAPVPTASDDFNPFGPIMSPQRMAMASLDGNADMMGGLGLMTPDGGMPQMMMASPGRSGGRRSMFDRLVGTGVDGTEDDGEDGDTESEAPAPDAGVEGVVTSAEL